MNTQLLKTRKARKRKQESEHGAEKARSALEQGGSPLSPREKSRAKHGEQEMRREKTLPRGQMPQHAVAYREVILGYAEAASESESRTATSFSLTMVYYAQSAYNTSVLSADVLVFRA